MVADPITYRVTGWVNEGIQFGLMGEYYASLRFFDEGVARHPDSLDCWHNRSVTLLCLGRGAEALASIDQALALAPLAPQALFLAGALRLDSGAMEAAIGFCERVATAHPPHRYGQLARRLGPLARMMPAGEVLELMETWIRTPYDLYYRV